MGTYTYQKSKEQLISNIQVARGQKKGSLLLRHANLVNVFSGEIYQTNILIDGDTIVGVSELYEEAEEIIELAGRYVIPGLIDTHVHLESSMVSPAEFANAVIPHGTTTVVWDPHEIANVLGIDGIEYALKATENIPLNIFFMASSCVPATHLETSGGKLTAKELERLIGNPRILGLAEMMNFPGVINNDSTVIEKLVLGRKSRLIDGHAPGLSGNDLNAYLASGVTSDHECTTKFEAMEKLRAGIHIMIREGSAAKNLFELISIVRDVHRDNVSFATDDRHPIDLARDGHIDNILRLAVGFGLSPIRSIQISTINAARYFHLDGHGAIAPGYRADVVVLSDLRSFQVDSVVKDGKKIYEFGKIIVDVPSYQDDKISNSVNIAPTHDKMFVIPAGNGAAKVIELVPNQIITKKVMLSPKIESHQVVSDTANDVLKLAVVERHFASGNVGLGLVKGFGLTKGALASSVGHDSHNIIIVGVNDADMKLAVEEIAKMHGGCVVVDNNKVIAKLPLTIGGLMSTEPISVVNKGLNDLHEAAKSLGCKVAEPFMTLSFLSLPPIPSLKLTDKGLVDVTKFEIVPLFGE